MSDIGSPKFEELRAKAEQILKQDKASAETHDLLFSFDEMLHELEVHQIELEMQHAELQETHRNLAQQRSNYLDLFDFAPIGYAVTNKQGIIVQANLTLVGMFDATRADIEGAAFTKFVQQEYKDIYYLHRLQTFESIQTQTCDIRLQAAQQEGSVPVRLDSAVIQGTELCRVAITDITQQKKSEQAMQTALERERELSELKGHLIEMISHEFRTPLTIILSSAELLERYSDQYNDARKAEKFKTIRDYITHLNHIVTETIESYRAQSDLIRIKPTTFDCLVSIRQVVSNIAINRSREIKFIEPDLSENTEIAFDETLLRQILINLLNNAIKYSEDIITCSLSLSERAFQVHIEDQGIGIADADQPYIFDYFYRGKNATNLISGTGIGLAVVKRLVEACQGHIEVHSIVNEGTRITLIFPRHLTN